MAIKLATLLTFAFIGLVLAASLIDLSNGVNPAVPDGTSVSVNINAAENFGNKACEAIEKVKCRIYDVAASLNSTDLSFHKTNG